ncbi:MAG: molybdate ABC transporter substrate-binding protein [Paracoccus sp. (in: a-proteobacteria)]|nr:molybdate ABC transporter substrate-binding protein [Paracoccus sp. (in: a-proteobacteria)]
MRLALTLTAALGLTMGAPALAQDEVTVFAAASLREALDDLAARHRAASGVAVIASYAGSSALARQIQEGAPADLFISASTAWMDALEGSGDIVADTRRDLLGNGLVLIAGAGAAPVELSSKTDLAALLEGGYLAMAMVDSVPAGVYGKEALVSLGLWESVQGSVAQADNVRAALAFVAQGEAPYGIVYATDARAEKGVEIVAIFPESSHAPITYPIALLPDAENAARGFYDYLISDEAAAIWRSYGFRTPGAAEPR